jgi:prolyl 4-hydroxylase
MCESGWTGRRAHQVARSILQPVGSAGRRVVPKPHLGGQRSLRVGSRQVDVLLSLDLPALVALGGFLSRKECAELVALAAELLRWPAEATERLQVQRYRPGGEYRAHYDYFDGVVPPLNGSGPGRQRVGTLLLYLQMPPRGGATIFHDVGLHLTPRVGDAVFFSYDQANPESHTSHSGELVEAGDKWLATLWFREVEEAAPGEAGVVR